MKSIRLAHLSTAAAILSTITLVASPRPFDEIIVFGHSGSDNGNLFILSRGLVAAPPYFNGRFSNGPLWVEHLAARLGLGKKNATVPAPSLAGGTCYAYGGADTGSGYSEACLGVGPTKTCAPNVGLQIDTFFAEGRKLDGDELIIVHAGDNDSSPQVAARNVANHVAFLAAAGGKAFLVPNMARRSNDPGEIEAGVSLDNFVASFNAKLAEELKTVETAFRIKIFQFDFLALNDAILASPATFGLTNVTEPACPGCGFGIPEPDAASTVVRNPDQYLYWDNFHFTASVHRIVGNAAAEFVLAVATVHAAAGKVAEFAAEAATPSVHVASVNTSVVWAGHGKLRGGNRYYGRAEVLIADHVGSPVSVARVTGTFSSTWLRKNQTVSGVTGPDGRVTLSTSTVQAYSPITFTFCVDDVAASLPYDPTEDVVTCDAGSL